MSFYSSSIFSDEELKEELRKLGYEQVSPEILTMIKDDLIKVFENELISSDMSISNERKTPENIRKEALKSPMEGKSTSSDQRCMRKTRYLNFPFSAQKSSNESDKILLDKIPQFSSCSSPDCAKTCRFSNINSENCVVNLKYLNAFTSLKRNDMQTKENFLSVKPKTVNSLETTSAISSSPSSNDSPLHIVFEHSSGSHNSSSSQKTIKRKVLRHRNGEPVISEEIVKIRFEFDTSYPESDSFNNSKSFSSEDISPKSNSSTGSLVNKSPKSSLRSTPSVLSLSSSKCSIATRILNSRKKKNDPVARYSYYKKFWDNFKPPGEKKHDKLRWAVRDKMLDYHL